MYIMNFYLIGIPVVSARPQGISGMRPILLAIPSARWAFALPSHYMGNWAPASEMFWGIGLPIWCCSLRILILGSACSLY
jgi:hypothetical protein